eukprot:TRINITY_DN2531_c1_g2_i5.p1 TRINITY_DN2531_c1_g2~~TRINITY_DN2531_c1_g2_i5.p1  ORF type:complete len:241 (-),score=22.48 TRINITY_DN2531_c1_g2_i5:192-914(-)
MQQGLQKRATFSRAAAVPRPAAPHPRPCVACAAVAECTDANAGDIKWAKTYYPTLADTAKAEKDWYIIDAEGQTLGRLAVLAAKYIRGKHTPAYTPSMDMGAMIVIVNAEKVVVTGRKTDDKLYRRQVNGLVGSMKVETFRQLQERFPEKIVEKAVHGMLPKGRLGRKIRLNLKVYKGPEHPHEAQTPIDITEKINGRFQIVRTCMGTVDAPVCSGPPGAAVPDSVSFSSRCSFCWQAAL